MESKENEYITLKPVKRTLVVIGNGFDIHCGLKSTYKDYFDSKNKDAFIKHVEGMIKDEKPDEEISDWIYEEWDGDKNFWFVYFLGMIVIKKTLGGNWYDIEALIQQFIRGVDSNDEVDSTLISVRDSLHYGVIMPHKWLELALVKIAREGKKDNFFRNEEHFYEYIFDELNSFEKTFGEYIKKQMRDNKEYLDKANSFMEALVDGSIVIGIDSFNYNNPFAGGKFGDVLRNVHGTVGHPIFGIGDIDEEFVKSRRLSSHSYDFEKRQKKRYLKVEQPKYSPADIDQVVIYGHSLSEQDQRYFNDLFDSIGFARPNSNASNKATLIFYYSPYGTRTEESALKKKADEVAALFRRYDKHVGAKDIMGAIENDRRLRFDSID